MGFNKGLIISVLVIGMCFVALSGLLLSVAFNYDVTVDPVYQDSFDTYSESNQLVRELDTTVEGGEVNPDGLGEAVYTNVVVAGKQSRASASLAQDLITQIPTVIGVDALIIGAMISILFAFATLGFIAMISRRTP